MIAASKFRILLLAGLALATACGGDGAPRANASTTNPTTVAEAKGDVIIAPPSAKYTPTTVAAPGVITGTVTLESPLPPLAPVGTGTESVLCGPAIPDESVQMQGGGLVGVVVWLDGLRSGKPLGIERRVELESDHCRLTPRVQAAAIGSAVNIIGHDEFRQHLRFIAGGDSTPRATILLGGGEQVIPTELPFRTPGLVVVRDTARAWTRAYLAVFDHPYFAVTGAGGTFTIDGVPPGKYTLHAWHERTAVATQTVEVGANGAVKVAVVLEGK